MHREAKPPSELPGNGQHNGHDERPEGKQAAHAARAELRRVATQLERAATERIALLEELLDRAATRTTRSANA